MRNYKRIYLAFTFSLIGFLSVGQSPDAFKYQAVVRDATGQVIINQDVSFQISILSGSTDGSSVYMETHTTTTNQFGLVNLNIGNGVTTDDLTNIDWGSNLFFIQVELDQNGGTDYQLMGTTQLLSVPYAIHAKTADSIIGTITESDPVYLASQAVNIEAEDITNLNNLSGANTGDQDLSTLASKSNVLELDNTTSFTPDADYEPATKKYVDDNAGATTYSVGDFAQGGIVFWLDETGQHGLVCAKKDQSTSLRWYAGTYLNTRAKGDGPFSGEANTSIIIASQAAFGDDINFYAASTCNDLQITENGKTYGDWYLPSKGELNLMYQNKTTIDDTATANGGNVFATSTYWSSTESDYNGVSSYAQSFSSGAQISVGKSTTFYVRAVRAF